MSNVTEGTFDNQMHHGIDETHFFFILKSVKDIHNFSATAMQLFCILPFYGFVSIISCSCVDPIVLMMSLQLVTIYMYKNGVYIIFV